MKTTLSLLLQLCVISITITQSTIQKEEAILKSRSLLKEAVNNQKCIGIAAGISINGVTQWAEAAGFADQKEKTAFTVETFNRTASIAKPMTAVAIMQLVEKGVLDLDEPVINYLPTFPNGASTTTRHLLSHLSGIDAYQSKKEINNSKSYQSLVEAMSLFQNRKLLSQPGEEFHYTSYGYVVLGVLIEKLSGMSYEMYMQKNIWDRIGMNHTGVEQIDHHNNKASLYHREKNGKIKKRKPNNLSDRIPAGGFQSTVPDLLKFGDALIQNTLISSESFELMKKDCGLKKEGNGYGFGLYLYGENEKYGEVVGHTGGQTGVSAFLMLLPEVHTSVVVLSNTSGAMQEVSDIIIKLYNIHLN